MCFVSNIYLCRGFEAVFGKDVWKYAFLAKRVHGLMLCITLSVNVEFIKRSVLWRNYSSALISVHSPVVQETN